MLMFESGKWVTFGTACAKRVASCPCIVRDGVWTGLRRRKKRWGNDWHVDSRYGQFSRKRREEMSAVPKSREEVAERRPQLLHLKCSVFRKWGRGDQVRPASHWSSPQHTTYVSQWRLSSQLRRPARIFKDWLRNLGGYHSSSCRAGREWAVL